MWSRTENLAGNRFYSRLTTAHMANCRKYHYKKYIPGVWILWQAGDSWWNNMKMLITQHRKSFRFPKILCAGKNHQRNVHMQNVTAAGMINSRTFQLLKILLCLWQGIPFQAAKGSNSCRWQEGSFYCGAQSTLVPGPWMSMVPVTPDPLHHYVLSTVTGLFIQHSL